MNYSHIIGEAPMRMMNPSVMVSRLDLAVWNLRRLGLCFVDSPWVFGFFGVFIEQRGSAGGGRGGHNPGAPWWVVPTSSAPRTASLLYKYPKNPRTLGESTKYSSSRRRVQNHQIQSRHHLGWGSPPPLVPLR